MARMVYLANWRGWDSFGIFFGRGGIMESLESLGATPVEWKLWHFVLKLLWCFALKLLFQLTQVTRVTRVTQLTQVTQVTRKWEL